MEKDCTSCINGDVDFPDVAIYKIVKAPMECRKTHGTFLCESHMDVVNADYGDEVKVEVLK